MLQLSNFINQESNYYLGYTKIVITSQTVCRSTWCLVLGWRFWLNLDFFAEGLHAVTAVVCLPVCQLGFIVTFFGQLLPKNSCRYVLGDAKPDILVIRRLHPSTYRRGKNPQHQLLSSVIWRKTSRLRHYTSLSTVTRWRCGRRYQHRQFTVRL